MEYYARPSGKLVLSSDRSQTFVFVNLGISSIDLHLIHNTDLRINLIHLQYPVVGMRYGYRDQAFNINDISPKIPILRSQFY